MEDRKTKKVSAFSQRLAGKYMTFGLADEDYGIEILKVQEIIQMQPITRVPRVAGYVRGVINLRGKVIPVIDLRLKFGFPAAEDTENTCIIVAQVEHKDTSIIMGVIIDEVKEVLDIAAAAIEETPSLGASINGDYIMAVGKVGETVKLLLDIEAVLATEEDSLSSS